MRIKWRKRLAVSGRISYSAEVRRSEYRRVGPRLRQRKRTLVVLGTIPSKPTRSEALAFWKNAATKLDPLDLGSKLERELLRRAAESFPKAPIRAKLTSTLHSARR